MIVRILDEAQYELPDDALAALEELDHELNSAIEAGNDERFGQVFTKLLNKIRQDGEKLSTSTIVPSDLTLPHEGATLAEVRELLASEPDSTESVTEGA